MSDFFKKHLKCEVVGEDLVTSIRWTPEKLQALEHIRKRRLERSCRRCGAETFDTSGICDDCADEQADRESRDGVC